MNQVTKQIKELTNKLVKTSAGRPPVKKLHPRRDWMIGLGVSVCIAAAVIAWSSYTYIANRDGGTTDVEIVVANPSYQAVLVDEALNIFETRSKNFNLVGTATIAPTTETSDEPKETEEDLSVATTTTPTASPETVEENIEDEIVEENPQSEVAELDDSLLAPELSQ